MGTGGSDGTITVVMITISTAVIFCTLVVFLCHRYVRRNFDDIDSVLESLLHKSEQLPFDVTTESRISKLTHKAVKTMQLYTRDVSQTNHEKEIIQSFLSDMSHQMKTPLAGISMYTDLLLDGNLSEAEQTEFLSRIKGGTEKLQWMMDSLIKMSRLEVGAIELSPVAAGIKQTISESIGSVYGAAMQKNIEIHVDIAQDVCILHDRKWTCEAMTNILENAVKYSHINGSIDISLDILPIYTRINFTDYGIGIASEEWNAIFKRFYRGKNVKMADGAAVEGAGLGLYLVSLILEKQGGYVLVDSKPRQYTTFSMFLQNCKN